MLHLCSFVPSLMQPVQWPPVRRCYLATHQPVPQRRRHLVRRQHRMLCTSRAAAAKQAAGAKGQHRIALQAAGSTFGMSDVAQACRRSRKK